MQDLTKFYIGGQWVDPLSTETLPVLNPATEARIGTVAMGNAQDVDRAVAAAKAAFVNFSTTSKSDRLDLLHRLKAATERRFEDLAQAMRMEMGAPITMARSAQADAAIGHLQGFIDALEQLDERQVLANGDVLLREPIGVCGLITPWNWPMNQIALKVIPALATGSTCVLKPSEHTPISAMVYAEIIDEAGYPPGVFNMVNGDGPTVGAALSHHPDVQMMSFTGSTRAGIAVTRDAAETVKRVTLELGGKSPNLVFADCDLETRVAESVRECMFNTGQSCDAPTRLLVERACYDDALRIAKRAAEGIAVGDPAQDGDHIGPLFDKIQFDRVQSMIEVGLAEGARLLAGGLGKPEGVDDRMVRQAHDLCRCIERYAYRAGRDFRSRARNHSVRRRGRGNRYCKRHALWTCCLSTDWRSRAGAARRWTATRRGNPYQRWRLQLRIALRRLQAVRQRPGRGADGVGGLSGNQDAARRRMKNNRL
jgi:aldehyde dehydrogenase (NAD+)